MADALLILGAGASRPAPSGLPTFLELTTAILDELGWRPQQEDEGSPVVWSRVGKGASAGFPSITIPWERLSPEVVFGTLHRFDIRFVHSLAPLMEAAPNAVHLIAARQLAAGGPVWTTNVDQLIENAFDDLVGRQEPVNRWFRVRLNPDAPVESVGELTPSTLVKFHGTIAVPNSLAFADRELLTPLADEMVECLASIAAGRHVAVHGYKGADVDLRHALRASLKAASEVVWFEPDETNRAQIAAGFRDVDGIRFLPENNRNAKPFQATADAFLSWADDAGLAKGVPVRLRSMLGGADLDGWTRPAIRVDLGQPAPAIVHARLVERFGKHRDEALALRLARREDIRRKNLRTAPQYARWSAASSLYGEGLVARAIRALLRHPQWLRLPTGPMRDVTLEKGMALLLVDGNWSELDRITSLALELRRTRDGRSIPSDSYYRAHALRYKFELDAARDAALDAEAGLQGSMDDEVDSERLAGAVLELGILDLYQARFLDALGRSSELKEKGRYAIQRWPAWGHWLAGFAHTYRGDITSAQREFRSAREYFASEPLERAVLDCVIGQLFLARLEVAVGGAAPIKDLPADWDRMSARQHDDVRLVLADHRLAARDVSGAGRLLEQVLRSPSNPAAKAEAALGMAHVRWLHQGDHAGFEKVRAHARRAGARWLEMQALAGLLRCDALDLESANAEIGTNASQLPGGSLTSLIIGDPPVLWLVT